jgi:hypothetical protein
MAETRPTRTAASDRSWTITGASAETREKVKAAADAEGMTIRAWVDKTLNAAADGRLVSSDGPSSIAVDPKTLAEISSKLDGLAKRLPENAKAAEKAAAQDMSALVLKVMASGFQEMQRAAKEHARVAEGKGTKKKRKKTTPATQATPASGKSTPAKNS